MKKYDVAVIGGGFAGVAAALAASRRGVKTILIEKSNALGGAANVALVNPFMPYWTRIDDKKTNLSAGIFKEVHDRLTERNAMRQEDFLEEELKLVLNRMALEAGVELLYHAYVYKSEKADDKITAVWVATKEGEMKIEADYFIDASGDAQLAHLSGCPTTLGREGDHLCQPMTLCFRVGGVDVDDFWNNLDTLQAEYKAAKERGEIKNIRENILVFRTPVPSVLHFNTTRIVKKNPTCTFDVTQAEIDAREQVFEMMDFLKKHANGFESAYLMMTAPEIGVRESRMIVGDYVLTEKDCRAFTKFDDGIAACNYDIDIHNPEGEGTSHYYFPVGEYYTIPYRCLIPKTVDNVLVAGRCISSDHGAQASYRIMPTVCCLGEAAGTAMSLAVKNNVGVRAVDVKELQALLIKNGAFLGKLN